MDFDVWMDGIDWAIHWMFVDVLRHWFWEVWL